MNARLLGGLVAGALLGLAACGSDDASSDASSDSGGDGGVEITDPWARTTPTGATIGAAYFVVESAAADTMEGASVDTSIAAGTQLHMTTDDDGTMTMEEMAGIELAAGEPATLEPAGTHVMLVDLAEPLTAGDTFELTLQFAEADDEVVTVEVRDEAP